MFLPSIARPCTALLLCLTAASLHGQSGDGFVVRERPGVVFVKPQPWSKDSEATMFEFQAFINRTAEGGSGAGYYEFRTKNAERRQIPTARIVMLVVYPDVQQFQNIIRPEERQVLVSGIEELRRVIAKYPSARTYLDPSIDKLNEEVARYDSGNVKTEGVWVPRETYVTRAANKLAGLLKADIARASPPSSMNLDDDPKFIGLQELAKSSADAKRLATEVSAQFEKLVRAEKRGDLMIKLGRPGTSLPEAKAALQELKTLRPDEDPKCATLVKAWDSGIATAKTTSAEAETISALLENELADFPAEGGPPDISPELENQIFALNGRIVRFLATRPPSQLIDAVQKAVAVCGAEADFKKLKASLEESQYIEAKDVLDDLARRATLIGPATTRVVSNLQRQAVEKIEQFTRLRAEGKLLAESGKKREALEKLEAAFKVIPDSEIEQNISQLKQGVSAVSSKGQ